MTPAGLYVHIPFCEARCHYCDFVTFIDKNPQIDAYLKALRFEISLYQPRKLQSLFIGGGTPSVLTPAQIEYLLTSIHSQLDTKSIEEATIEMNPESTTPEKLKAYQMGGINRISFGLQTTKNSMLLKLGRLHDSERFFQVFREARALGFQNINVDLMFGLPGQTTEDWSRTLKDIIELQPEHISAYALKVEPGTEFYRQGVSADGDLQADMYLQASQLLAGSGYLHYEISNFAKPGMESKHNLLYWLNAETIGVGVSSASYLEGRRLKNASSFQTYLERSENGLPPQRTEEILDSGERERENVMLKLRLKDGIELETLEKMSIPKVDLFLSQGLAQIRDGRFSLTPQGWLLSNQLFQHLVRQPELAGAVANS